MTKLQARIEKLIADENVKHIQLWFTDIQRPAGAPAAPALLGRERRSLVRPGTARDRSLVIARGRLQNCKSQDSTA
jgi:hypothetical protein